MAPLEGTQGSKDSGHQVFCPPSGAPTPQGGSPKHPSPFLGQVRATVSLPRGPDLPTVSSGRCGLKGPRARTCRHGCAPLPSAGQAGRTATWQGLAVPRLRVPACSSGTPVAALRGLPCTCPSGEAPACSALC